MRAVIVITATAAVFFIWLSWAARRMSAQKLRTLAAASCTNCDGPFGADAAKTARDEHVSYCNEQRKLNPGLRINFRRSWDVTCTQCGTRARFDFQTLKMDRDSP